MTYHFGEANGRPADAVDVRALSMDRLHALYAQLDRSRRTSDMNAARMAADRAAAKQLFDLVRHEVLRRGGLPRAAAR